MFGIVCLELFEMCLGSYNLSVTINRRHINRWCLRLD